MIDVLFWVFFPLCVVLVLRSAWQHLAGLRSRSSGSDGAAPCPAPVSRSESPQ